MPRILVILAAALFLLSSCRDNDYERAVPHETESLVAFDMVRLSAKIHPDELAAEDSLSPVAAFLQRAVMEPGESGLDMKCKGYVFWNEGQCGFLMAVKDRNDLATMVSRMKNDGIVSMTLDEDDVSFFAIGNYLAGYDRRAIIGLPFYGDITLFAKRIRKYLAQSKKKSFVSQPVFEKIKGTEGDIVAYSQLESLISSVPVLSELGWGSYRILSSADLSDKGLECSSEIFSSSSVKQDELDSFSSSQERIAGTFLDETVSDNGLMIAAHISSKTIRDFLDGNRQVAYSLDMLSQVVPAKNLVLAIDGDISIMAKDQGGLSVRAHLSQPGILADKSSWLASSHIMGVSLRPDGDGLVAEGIADSPLRIRCEGNDLIAESDGFATGKDRLSDKEKKMIRSSVLYVKISSSDMMRKMLPEGYMPLADSLYSAELSFDSPKSFHMSLKGNNLLRSILSCMK